MFDFAAARGDRPILVRAFNPTRGRARLRARRLGAETTSEDLPFLVDSVREEITAEGLACSARCTRSSGWSATTTGASPASLHPREATTRESVMHFDLDRPRRRGAGRARRRGRSVLGDVRRAVLDFPAMADRGRRMVQLAGAGAARYADDEVDETVAFLEWLLARPLHLPRLPRVQDRRGRDQRRAGLRARHPRRRGDRRRSPGRGRSPSCRPTCASARSRATC